MSEEHQSSAEKATKRIKEVGTFSQILGWWKIVTATVLPAILADNNELSEFLNYSYSDLALNIVFGIVLIILGSRIKGSIHKSTKKYVWVIMILSGIFGFINIAMSGKTSITFLLFAFSIYVLTQFKHVKISDEKPKYKITGKKWALVVGAFVLIFGAGLVLDLNQYGYFIDEENLTIPATDKNSDNSEQIGNLYRNNTYSFRIKFPEGWEQMSGDGPHILWKAVDEGNSINVGVQEFPAEFKYQDINIRDVASEEEYFNEIKNGFPGAKLIDSGFTKIDNKDAFYIEYTAPYEALDVKVVVHNKVWQVVHNNALFMITAGAPENEYSALEKDFALSVGSFVFEN